MQNQSDLLAVMILSDVKCRYNKNRTYVKKFFNKGIECKLFEQISLSFFLYLTLSLSHAISSHSLTLFLFFFFLSQFLSLFSLFLLSYFLLSHFLSISRSIFLSLLNCKFLQKNS
jgi:hypothetical protein